MPGQSWSEHQLLSLSLIYYTVGLIILWFFQFSVFNTVSLWYSEVFELFSRYIVKSNKWLFNQFLQKRGKNCFGINIYIVGCVMWGQVSGLSSADVTNPAQHFTEHNTTLKTITYVLLTHMLLIHNIFNTYHWTR